MVCIKFKLMAARVKPLLRLGYYGVPPSSAYNSYNKKVVLTEGRPST